MQHTKIRFDKLAYLTKENSVSK